MFLMAASPGARGGSTVLKTANMTFPFFGGNIFTDFSLPSFYDNFSKEGLKNADLNATLNQKIQIFQEAI